METIFLVVQHNCRGDWTPFSKILAQLLVLPRMLHFNVCHFYPYFHHSCVGETDTCIELATVLAFTTGAEAILPIGFNEPLLLHFNSYNRFPTASTCALELTLPTQYYNNCNEF